jgi:hypothetical protein
MTAPEGTTTNAAASNSTLTLPTATVTFPSTAAAPQAPVAAPNAPAAGAQQGAPDAGAQAPAEGDGKKSLADLIAALPESDQKVILGEVSKARSDAKNYRTQLREADPTKVRSEVMTEVAKALGLAQEQAPDPAALAQQLAERTSVATQAQRELAVYKAAASASANPNALLDSVSFMRSLADVDPADGEAIGEAIKAALAVNPNLSLQPQRRVPGPNPALGSSDNGAPDLEALIADAQKRGDLMQVIRLQNQKLAAPQR